jgi:ribosomal protein S1
VVDAVVSKITPFGIHLDLVGNKLKAKLEIDELMKKQIEDKTIQVGTVVPIIIKHLSATKIVVEKVVNS